MKDSLKKCAQILWEYNHMSHVISTADIILVLGSYDLTVAQRAVDLYKQQYAPTILFSGGYGKYTLGVFEKSEAEVFADIALENGVPHSDILLEIKSTNTGENVVFSKQLLQEKSMDIKTCIVVTKPYMERRAFATFKKRWPEVEIMVTSPIIDMEAYIQSVNKDEKSVISSIVADTQRIKLYPEKGYQIYQEIPAEVWDAWEVLVKNGYIDRLI